MTLFRNCIVWAMALVALAGCKEKKKISLSGDDPVEVADFIAFFQSLPLPFQYADSSLQKTKKENDSLLISYKVFTQFVPDSIIHKLYGKGAKPKLYVIGKAEVPKAETYLFVKAILAGKKSVLILAFDKKRQFLAGMPALRPDENMATRQSLMMDRRYTITKTMLRRNRDGSLSEGKDVFVLNTDAKMFTLIMTDALEDKPTELINPIDTLSRKQKWTADYSNGKMNLVSIRDGRRSNQFIFFIHFDKGGDCSGELKGDATITGSNTAEYRKDGDPCKLKFIFTSSSVTLKEVEGCGSYRPLKCSFDGNFARKREPKPKQTMVRKPSRNK